MEQEPRPAVARPETPRQASFPSRLELSQWLPHAAPAPIHAVSPFAVRRVRPQLRIILSETALDNDRGLYVASRQQPGQLQADICNDMDVNRPMVAHAQPIDGVDVGAAPESVTKLHLYTIFMPFRAILILSKCQ